ncbi:MAG: hypothetical protein HOP23_10160 [Methylococcaceae bacterium]|nr:hypothetical protein [Methylococcaceae bacterium]
MKKQKLLAMFFIVNMLSVPVAFAAEHHSGHKMAGGGSGESASTCLKPHVSKFTPAHLAKVAPGSEFSFVAFNISNPEHITATVKKVPVELVAEFKDPFYVVKGKLPAFLKNTAARINVKVSGKTSHCELENGWLVNITE